MEKALFVVFWKSEAHCRRLDFKPEHIFAAVLGTAFEFRGGGSSWWATVPLAPRRRS